ncbi:DUF2240 family protein, partial [Candidatus Micrarchaeota archaeon]|nr:DUF2240 family protein [Candidatus Micrarchaeota archaeon]
MNHQASYKELLAKLQEKTGKTEEAINKQLEEKTKKFSGLLSKEAALFLLAKEAGITPNQDRLVELTPINQL